MTAWDAPNLRTVGGHLVTPVGRCTARADIHREPCSVKFVVLEKCSRDIILGIDFLYEYGAVIDLSSNSLTLRIPEAPRTHREPSFTSVRVLEEHVKLPPLASVFLLVQVDTFPDGEALLEGSIRFLLEKGIGVARGLLWLQNACAEVLVANFRNDSQHLTKGMAVAHIENIAEISAVDVLADAGTSQIVASAELDVNANLLGQQRSELLSLLDELRRCFATPSGVG